MMDKSHSVDSLGDDRTRYRYAAPGRYTGQPSLITQPQLCEECNKNQASKILELNSFEPSRESDFKSELDVHKQRLDERYKLCQSCDDIVTKHLKTQAMDLKAFLLGSHLQQSKSTPTKLLKRSSSPESISLVLAQLACVFLASMLVCSESLSGDHRCGEAVKSLNSSSRVNGGTFFSSFSTASLATTAKHLVLNFTSSVRVLRSISWKRGVELVLCLSSLTKRRYLHVCLVCLLLNVLIFLKRKTRFGILVLLAWTSLSGLRCWEIFWFKADCRWRPAGAMFCWFLCASSFLVSLLSYSRVLGTRRKRRGQFTPSQLSPENSPTNESETMETEDESTTISSEKIHVATELDCNLHGLSLGLPAKMKNGFNAQSSPGGLDRTGSFWSQSVSSNSKESPLVSMNQRPLIVPATLNFSGLRQRFYTNHTQRSASVSRPLGMNSYAISLDEETISDALHEELHGQCSRMYIDKQAKPEKTPRKKRRPSSSCNTRTRFFNARTFLLLASLLLNVYFIVFFTEWPRRVLRSLLKIFKR